MATDVTVDSVGATKRVSRRLALSVSMAFITCSRLPLSISTLSSVTLSSSTSKYCFLRRRESLADSLFRSNLFCRRWFRAPPPALPVSRVEELVEEALIVIGFLDL